MHYKKYSNLNGSYTLEAGPVSPLFDDPSLTPAGVTCVLLLLNYNLLTCLETLKNVQ